jgi:acetyltransferase
MRGVYLNIDDERTFNEAWENLMVSMEKFNLRNVSILAQEMISESVEVIVGVNTDESFGKVLLFGSGGIYTEVIKDTSLGVLPITDFSALIGSTKVGTILNGVRGKSPKAVKQLINLLEKIQQIVIDIPQIQSMDLNPVLVTEDRAIAVDFKIMLRN